MADAAMKKRIVDAKGQSCPTPVVMTKKALAELNVGEEMTVIVDNETAKSNVENFLISNGAACETSEEGGVFTIKVKKGRCETPQSETNQTCGNSHMKHVIAIKSNRMGHGSDELGEILIRAFINTIQEVQPLPEAVIFYNSGIEFSLKDSPVLETLQELESMGVNIIVCGTCVQHFNQKENVAVGTISNMYDILEILSRASHVVTP